MEQKQTFGQKIHKQIFGLAAELYPEALGAAELIALIREDIVELKLSAKPSLSSLTVEQKTKLANAYLKRLGRKYKIQAPSKYNERERKPAAGTWLPSVGQRELVERLFDDLSYPQGEPRARFCFRICKRRTPSTRAEIGQVIQALERMQQQGWRYGVQKG